MRDEELWLQGRYNFEALMVGLAHLGAGLSGKQCKAEYPAMPFTKKAEEENRILTEKEKVQQREMFVAQLLLMKSNFELTHKKEQGE